MNTETQLSEASLNQALADIITEDKPVAIVPTAIVVNRDDNPYLAFNQDCELLNASWSLDSGRTVEFRITGEAFDRLHPFKRFTQRRGGRAGTRFTLSVAELAHGALVYHGPAMLASWGDSSTLGQHFKLWLDEDADRHPFAGFTRRKGQIPGELFAVILVELDDDETPINQAQREKVEAAYRGAKAKDGADAQTQATRRQAAGIAAPEVVGGTADRAGRPAKGASPVPARGPKKYSSSVHLMVTGPQFVRWLVETRPKLVKQWTPDLAKRYVKKVIGVESLSHLDKDTEALKRFHEKIRRPFERWAHQDP